MESVGITKRFHVVTNLFVLIRGLTYSELVSAMFHVVTNLFVPIQRENE